MLGVDLGEELLAALLAFCKGDGVAQGFVVGEVGGEVGCAGEEGLAQDGEAVDGLGCVSWL